MMLIPLIFINIWAVVIRLNVEKYQVVYTLFQGIYFLILSLLCIMAGYRFFRLYHQEYGLLYIFVTITLQILFLLMCFKYQKNALKEGRYSSKYKKKKKSKTNIFWRVIGVLGVLGGGGGLVLGKIFVVNFKGDQSSITLGLAIALVVLGYLMSLGINCIHKYYLMKQYRPELFHK
jgi:magnesium-transporting ATPase (P-type)